MNFREAPKGLGLGNVYRCGVDGVLGGQLSMIVDFYGIRTIFCTTDIIGFGIENEVKKRNISVIPIKLDGPVVDDACVGGEFYSEAYVSMAKKSRSVLIQATGAIQTAVPNVLVCCRLGKDRTGLLVAALMLESGHSMSDIVVEFGLSHRYFRANAGILEPHWTKRGSSEKEYMKRFNMDGGSVAAFVEELKSWIPGEGGRRS